VAEAAAPPEPIVEAAPVPAVPLEIGAAPAPAHERMPSIERRAQGPRQAALGHGREALVRESANEGPPSTRTSDETIRVPRVAIERGWSERSATGERRFDRRLPQLESRDTQRPLEHLREVARQRRERFGAERGTGQRAPVLERLRERRERTIERRDGAGERERREGERRERGGR
jgi:hypothetical protein